MVRVPSELFEIEDAEDEPQVPPDALTPEHVETDVIFSRLEGRSTPAYPTRTGDDTSPGVFEPGDDPDDLAAVPTRIEPHVEGLGEPEGEGTDEHEEPVRSDADVDTGPVRAPEHDTNH